jgi:hypothetical protein
VVCALLALAAFSYIPNARAASRRMVLLLNNFRFAVHRVRIPDHNAAIRSSRTNATLQQVVAAQYPPRPASN